MKLTLLLPLVLLGACPARDSARVSSTAHSTPDAATTHDEAAAPLPVDSTQRDRGHFHKAGVVFVVRGDRDSHQSATLVRAIEAEFPGTRIEPGLPADLLESAEREAKATSPEATETVQAISRYLIACVPTTVPMDAVLAYITARPEVESGYIDSGVMTADKTPDDVVDPESIAGPCGA